MTSGPGLSSCTDLMTGVRLKAKLPHAGRHDAIEKGGQ